MRSLHTDMCFLVKDAVSPDVVRALVLFRGAASIAQLLLEFP